jgi:hypothetical protein
MRPQRMDEACRHRSKYELPPTPEHYWTIAFPTNEECIERGYGGVITQPNEPAKRPRRRKPLKLKENNNDTEDINY